MPDRLRFLQHQGHEILLVDFSAAEGEEILDLLPKIQVTVTDKPRGSVLVLADFCEAHIDRAVAMRIKEVLALDRPYVKRAAWVGTETLPNVFYEGFKQFSQRDFPKFKTREEALEWLVKDQTELSS
jgi:hypothetical protein